MRPTNLRRKKHFTVEQANRCLPLVRSIVRDWVTLAAQVAERRERVAYLVAGRDPNVDDVYGDELAEVESSLDKAAKRLDFYVGELLQLGVLPFDANTGAVDFPAEVEGQEAFLCWELQEPEVAHWRLKGDEYPRPLVSEISGALGGDSPADFSHDAE